MEQRLRAHDIHKVKSLCEANRPKLHAVWGGIEGDRMYAMLRGELTGPGDPSEDPLGIRMFWSPG